MAEKKRLALALSIDVEEEGLFSGTYPCRKPTLRNISELNRLVPFFERGIKASLFCVHSAFTDSSSQKMLARMRDNYGAEIGAHLHHWNTPPFRAGQTSSTVLKRAWSAKVPLEDVRAKLETLFGAAHQFMGAPVDVFRMGRWDIHAGHWQILHDLGVRYDASVRPLHAFRYPEGPNHFFAPSDPYKIKLDDGVIREIPLTCVPLLESFKHVKFFCNNLRKWGALALLPLEHPLWLMKLTTMLHVARGGQTLSLTWHSSEMMPGGSPKIRDVRDLDHFLNKILLWLDWLEEEFTMEYLTVSQMGAKFARNSLPAPEKADWTFSEFETREK